MPLAGPFTSPLRPLWVPTTRRTNHRQGRLAQPGAAADQRLDDLRVDHRSAGGNVAQRGQQVVQVADPVVEEVGEPGIAVAEQLDCVRLVGVLGQTPVSRVRSYGYWAVMTEPHVTLGQADLGPVPEKLRQPLEEQLSSALQRATEVVSNDYHGESVDEVAARLLAETRSALHPDIAATFQPDPTQMRRLAEVIVSQH